MFCYASIIAFLLTRQPSARVSFIISSFKQFSQVHMQYSHSSPKVYSLLKSSNYRIAIGAVAAALFLLLLMFTSSSSLGSTLRVQSSEEAEEAQIRAELGHGTWNMLHRMAAQFPKTPTAEERESIVQFFDTFSQRYPCPVCAEHFRGVLKENPVQAGDNSELSLWLCKVHNIVNTRLNKPQFSCTLDALKEKWGSCGCFDKEKEGE